MESKEDSIKILETRIRQQMNQSLEKYMRSESIRYYASTSGILGQQEFQHESRIDESGDLRQDIQIDEKGNLRQGIYIDEKGNLQQNIYIDEKGNLQRSIYINDKENPRQELYIAGKENPRQDIYTDERSDLRQRGSGEETEISGQSGYENLTTDMEYIDRMSEMARMIEHVEISETKEAQHAKAKSGYESVRQSLETEKSFQASKSWGFDAKG